MNWERNRRLGKWGTLVMSGILLLYVLPYVYMTAAHVRVDSEVGVMMYAVPVFIAVSLTAPVVACFAILWGLGLRRARQDGIEYRNWEPWTCGLVGGTACLAALFFIDAYVNLLFGR